MLKPISDFIEASYDNIIALFIIVIVFSVNAYQVLNGADGRMGYEAVLIIIGYLFGKRLSHQ